MFLERRHVQLVRFLLQGGCKRGIHFIPGDQVYSHLERRGIVVKQDESEPALLQHLKHGSFVKDKSKSLYLGVDPTASSMHIGHLLPLMVLLHFHVSGHQVIPLIGGATGLIGDPTGRQTARDPTYLEKVHFNAQKLTEQLQRFFITASRYASRKGMDVQEVPVPTVYNNTSWHQEMKMIDFLRDVGSFAKLQTMLSRESVKSRMSSATGLPFSEFTYQLLQAYDFYKLYRDYGCTIQIGGSDQWGNILAGIELISKKFSSNLNRSPAFGILTTLLTTTGGEKIGKSQGNAVWLDSNQTSVFDFYQYFIKVEDAVVGAMLRYFTFVPLEDIADIMEEHEKAPEKRLAQRQLAQEVTELIHGENAIKQAEAATKVLFGTSISQIQAEDLLSVLEEGRQAFIVPRDELLGKSIPQLAATYKLTSSISEAKQLASASGLYLNGIVTPIKKIIESDLIDGRFLILRAGKSKHVVLALPVL